MPVIDPQYLQAGAAWPPQNESSRVKAMGDNLRLYNGDFSVLNPGEKEPRIKINWFRGVVRFWRDTMFGDPPVFDYMEGGRPLEFIGALTPSIIAAAKQALVNSLRYGVGVMVNRKPGMVENIDPRFWVPVTAPYDVNDVRGHLVAYPFASNPEGNGGTYNKGGNPYVAGDNAPDKVRAYRFLPSGEDGNWTCSAATFGYSGNSLGEMDGDWEDSACGMMPLVPVVLNGAGIYGESEYDDMRSPLNELNKRESGIAAALDKHNNPHLAVPEGALKTDENGRVVVSAEGMVLPVPEGSRPPSYVMWDAKFGAHTESIERMQSRVLIMSAISPVLVDPEKNSGNIASSVALRRLAMLTVSRIRTFRTIFEEAFKDAIVGALSMQGANGGEVVSLEREKIRVNWPDPLSAGDYDDVDGVVALLNAGAISLQDAVQITGRKNSEEARMIVEINEAGMARRMAAARPPSGGNGDGGEE